jgi:hypothetical protein
MLRLFGWVIALLIVARIALWSVSDALITIPEGQMHSLYINNEALVHLRPAQSPKVIVAGSSRLGVVAGEVLAPHLPGVAADEVANYSLAGNTFWRTLAFFRRQPQVLENAEHVVIDLLPQQLYISPIFNEDDELFLRLATFEERFRVTGLVKRGKAYADAVFPVWSERHSVSGWLFGLRQIPRGVTERYEASVAALGETADWRARLLEDDIGAAEAVRMDGYAPPPMVSRVQVMAIHELLDVLPERCRLHLVWMPVREDYTSWLRDDVDGRTSLTVFRELIEELDDARVNVVWHGDASAEGLTGDDYMDIVHFTESGRDKACALLAADILKGEGGDGEHGEAAEELGE